MTKNKHEKSNTITIRLPIFDMWKLLTLVLLVLVLTNLYWTYTIINRNEIVENTLETNDQPTQLREIPSNQPSQEPTQQEPSKIEVSVDDDAMKGSANASVTIIEFSDFECPFCTRFWEQTLPQIEKEYIATGKVNFVYRDFPLSFHPNAQKAAEAAECAGEQGKYWEMHDKIFETGALGITSLKQHAVDLGLDSKKFDDCLDSGKYASEVQKDFQDGQAAGVTGTPAFFINGIKVVGAQPFSAFQQIIEQELDRGNKK